MIKREPNPNSEIYMHARILHALPLKVTIAAISYVKSPLTSLILTRGSLSTAPFVVTNALLSVKSHKIDYELMLKLFFKNFYLSIGAS